MYPVLLGIAVLCFLYWAVLLAKGVDFCVIWLLIGAVFLAAGGYWRYRVQNPQGFRLPQGVLILCGVCAVLALALFLTVEGLILKEMLRAPQPDADVLIVLGAQVKGENPSRALLRRLEAARSYLEENPRTIAVLSGGQGDGEDISEAKCMYRYLTAEGIAGERLILEERSTTTRENLIFSAEKIAARFGGNGMSLKTVILSNNFHIYRALLLAQKCGYTEISGIAAKSDWRLQIHYLMREFFALLKEKADGNI